MPGDYLRSLDDRAEVVTSQGADKYILGQLWDMGVDHELDGGGLRIFLMGGAPPIPPHVG